MTIPVNVTVLATILLITQFALYAARVLFISLDVLLIGQLVPDPDKLINRGMISCQKIF